MADMFRAPDSRAVPAVTAAEMREIGRVATAELELALLSTMENAGQALVSNARERADGPVTVLAGTGGTGAASYRLTDPLQPGSRRPGWC